MKNNCLKAAFWDYPQFQSYDSIHNALRKAKDEQDIQTYRWIMSRLLERGRVKDVAAFFRIETVKNNIESLRLSDYSIKKWHRLLEVYETKN